MLQRRKKNKVRKWASWTIGVIVGILVILAFIKIDDIVMAQGIAEPGQKIYIDSPLTRVVKRIVAESGDTVIAGDVVVLLYNGDLQADVVATEKLLKGAQATLRVANARLTRLEEQPTKEELGIAESQHEQAQINLKARGQTLERAKHLFLGEKLWSQDDLDRAQTSYDLAKANLKVSFENLNLVRRGPLPSEMRQAQAEVQESQASLERTTQALNASREELERATIRSPVDGVVARQDLYSGMLANQGQIIMIIAGFSRSPVISARMGETDAWKVRPGQPVEILSNLFTDPEEFQGRGEISEVFGYAVHEDGARTFDLEVAIKETPIPLRYGSTADLRVIVGRRSILQTIFGIETDFAIDASRGMEMPIRSRQAPTPKIAKPNAAPETKPVNPPTSSLDIKRSDLTLANP
ncbi:MAG: efflux RND transporter periplasmic adaptor subunit [Candidatus Latescibacterota bacterium]|nr:efflux RND transporter periplasmic adaptor subunit [Candidatus Latescibacterota bacterium]